MLIQFGYHKIILIEFLLFKYAKSNDTILIADGNYTYSPDFYYILNKSLTIIGKGSYTVIDISILFDSVTIKVKDILFTKTIEVSNSSSSEFSDVVFMPDYFANAGIVITRSKNIRFLKISSYGTEGAGFCSTGFPVAGPASNGVNIDFSTNIFFDSSVLIGGPPSDFFCRRGCMPIGPGYSIFISDSSSATLRYCILQNASFTDDTSSLELINTVGISEETDKVPQNFNLNQNYPNPSTPSQQFHFRFLSPNMWS